MSSKPEKDAAGEQKVGVYICHCGGNISDHVDVQQLAENVKDLREVGVEEVLSDPSAIAAVEWPKDTLATWIPADARIWRVRIIVESDDCRKIEIVPPTAF